MKKQRLQRYGQWGIILAIDDNPHANKPEKSIVRFYTGHGMEDYQEQLDFYNYSGVKSVMIYSRFGLSNAESTLFIAAVSGLDKITADEEGLQGAIGIARALKAIHTRQASKK